MRNKTKRSTLPGASSQELSAGSLQDLRGTESIVQSEAHFRAIFENAREGFVLIDREGTILIFNSVAEKCILLNHGANPAKVGDSIYDHRLGDDPNVDNDLGFPALYTAGFFWSFVGL